MAIIEAILGIKEALSFGLTFYDGGRALQSVLAGNTVSKRLDRIEEMLGTQFQILEAHLGACTVEETTNLAETSQKADVQKVLAPMHDVQHALDLELTHSQPIVSPERFTQVFRENPEELLRNVKQLKSVDIPAELFDDPTYAPVVFDKWGVKFVGWMKTGVLRASFDTQYEPAVAEIVNGGFAQAAPAGAVAGIAAANLVDPPVMAERWAAPVTKRTTHWEVALPSGPSDHFTAPTMASRTSIGFTLSGPNFAKPWPLSVGFLERRVGKPNFLSLSIGPQRLSKTVEYAKHTVYTTPVETFSGDLTVGHISFVRSMDDFVDRYSIDVILPASAEGNGFCVQAVIVQNDDLARQGRDGVLSIWRPV